MCENLLTTISSPGSPPHSPNKQKSLIVWGMSTTARAAMLRLPTSLLFTRCCLPWVILSPIFLHSGNESDALRTCLCEVYCVVLGPAAPSSVRLEFRPLLASLSLLCSLGGDTLHLSEIIRCPPGGDYSSAGCDGVAKIFWISKEEEKKKRV